MRGRDFRRSKLKTNEIEEEQSDDEEQEMRTRSGTARKSYFLVGDSKP